MQHENRTQLFRWTRLVALIALFGADLPLSAQDAPDVPGRGVARISLINGEANVRRGDSGDWIAGAVNAPLVELDRLATTPGSRAELQLDYSNFVRLASDSEVRLSELGNRRFTVQVARGLVTYSILRDFTADVEISTPSVAVRPRRQGAYRVEVLDDGTTEVTVRDGEVEVFTPSGTRRLSEGRTMRVRGDVANAEFQLVDARANDAWDRWVDERDRYLRRSVSNRYLSRDIYGWEDLDAHGAWVNVAPYGMVWTPRVRTGWAPYRFGRWVWLDYYGWSWVSADPWGWAPYHYGRWFFDARAGWCWWPGGVGVRTWWRPALVAWFGFGNVGVGFGRLGWVPLAPYDPFHPWYGPGWYGRGRGFGNRITIVNNTNITNIYRNSRIDNAITAVDSGRFGRGNFGGDSIRVNRSDLNDARLVRGGVPVVPSQESLRWADRDVQPVGSGRGEPARFYSTRGQVANVERVPFEQQRAAAEQMTREAFGSGRGEVGGGSVERAVAGSGGVRGAESSGRSLDQNAGTWRDTSSVQEQGSGRGNVGGSWRRFGEPVSSDAGRGSSSSRGEDASPSNGGWRRFGDPGGADVGRSNTGSGRGDLAPGTSVPGGSVRGSDRGSYSYGGNEDRSTSGGWRGSSGRGEVQSYPSRDSGGSNRGSDRGSQNYPGPTSVDRGSDRGGDRSGWNNGGGGMRGSESIRVSPPVVRDSGGSMRGGDSGGYRGAGDSGGSRSSGGGYGGGGVRGGSSGPSGGGSGRGDSGGGGSRSSGGGGGRRDQ